MAYNIPDSYKNQTPAPRLDKATLNKMAWRSIFLQSSFNYERMQAGGWLYGILPGLEKIHTDKDDLAASMSHNLEFFNTHPFLVTFVRVAAMGPLGGIGDALFWFTLVPIVAGISSDFALKGSIAGPLLFLAVFNIFQFAIRYWLMHWSYNLGTDAIGIFTANAKEFTRAASILGVFVVGALTSLYGGTKLGIQIANGEKPIVIQAILDGVLPKLIPLGITLGLYYLLARKKWTPLRCIVLLLVAGIGLAFLGHVLGVTFWG